ncbi:MAG: DUF4974 domain-containing protein [Sphingobacterium sp.]|nr:DUF4974 domain-containing protein [Sphingobacterium sp.]
MNDKKELIGRYLNGSISKAELDQLLASLEDADAFISWESDWKQAWEEDIAGIALQDMADVPRSAAEKALFNRIEHTINAIDEGQSDIDSKYAVSPVARPGIWRLSPWRLYAAAVALLVLSFGVLYYKNMNSADKLSTESRLTKSEAKFDNKVVLRRGDGTVIPLEGDHGKIASTARGITYQTDNKRVDLISSQTEKLTLNTPKGMIYSLELSDGTKVWLNAASSLSYSVGLLNGNFEREVYLEGEAYFEVKKDEKHPFIVRSQRQDIRVLGTHFNVNAYADEESIRTTLLEGKVQVTSADIEKSAVYLRPSQQARLQHGAFEVATVDPALSLDWKNGQFQFERENLSAVMRKIARWYDIEVSFDKDYNRNDFSGTISRNTSLDEVLTLLELTGLAHFKKEGRRVVVMP